MAVYKFIVTEQANAKAFLVEGRAPNQSKILVAMFYYDYGVSRETIEGVAGVFAEQLNKEPLEVPEA